MLRWLVMTAFLTTVCAGSRSMAGNESGPPEAPQSPWSKGVSKAAQSAALALFNQGNELFDQSKYSAALPVFERALKKWKHPAIHFNIAVCLVHAGRAIEAIGHLEEAMKYGATPLEKRTFARGQTYRLLLQGQLTKLRVSCQGQGEVKLDGKRVLSCPGKFEGWVTPGNHQVVARRDGFEPFEQSIDAKAGQSASVTPTFKPIATGAVERVTQVEERRWPIWLPWTVLASGVAISAAGVPLLASADDNFERYRAGVESECPLGCPRSELSPGVRSARDRGNTRRTLGISAYSAGAALVVGGAIMAVLNRAELRERAVVGVTPRSVHLIVRF